MRVFLIALLGILSVSAFHLGFLTQLQHKQTASSLSAVYTTFKVMYPQTNLPASSTIFLRGDNCNLTWTKGVQMKKSTTQSNIWATAMLCPLDTKISVKALINDTKWMMGSNHILTLTSQLRQTTIYPSFNPSLNKIFDSPPISSQILKNQRKISIYYPPSYHDNPYKKYQLLFLHDGQNLFDPSKAAFGVAWMCQNTVNTLIAEGKIEEVVIVGIWNTNDRINQYTYSYDPEEKMGGKGDLYLDFIQKELLPKVKSQYFQGRINDAKGIGIGGSSLGGLISCYALYTRPTTYNKAICMSSSFWWNNQDFKKMVQTTKTYNPSSTFYLDSGDSGPSQDNKASTDNAKAALIVKGYIENKNLFYYLDKGGQHSQSYWGKRFWVPMTDLYGTG